MAINDNTSSTEDYYSGAATDRFLINTKGERILTLPSVLNFVIAGGGGDYSFEYHRLDSVYLGDIGGYGDGLLWLYTGLPVKEHLNELSSFTFEDVTSEHMSNINYGGKNTCYIDLTGKVIIPQNFDGAYPFKEGLAAVEGNLEKTSVEDWYGREQEVTNGNYGYIDKAGNTVIDFKFEYASSFSGGLAYASNEDRKYGYINKTGAVVVPMVYDSAFGAGDGLCSVGNIVGTTVNSFGNEVDRYKYGYTDTKGNIVVPLEYDDISQFVNGVAYAIKDGKIHILTAGEALTANPSASTVLVDGKNVSFDAYNINDNNFFKLRDLAYILSGSEKQFEVEWDAANNAIKLTSGRAYTIVGGEMTGKGAGSKLPTPTASKILLDGKEITLTAYNIEDNNYFKLRDIGEAFDFEVDWDGANNTIVIDTGKGYTAD